MNFFSEGHPTATELTAVAAAVAGGLTALVAAALLIYARFNDVVGTAAYAWKRARRLVILVVGVTILLIGAAMLVLPGPAMVVIPAGLAILATEFVWARRLLQRVKAQANSIVGYAIGRHGDGRAVGGGTDAARRIAWAALAGGLVITAGKGGVYWLTGSVAALSDALESIVNLVAASMTVWSTWYASRPPDREHPYGHGKVEFITAGIEGAMIFLAGVTIAFEAGRRLVIGTQPERLDWGVAGMVVLSLALAGLGWWVRQRGRRHSSPALIADGVHLLTDAITTVVVAVGLGLVRLTGWNWLDPLLALLVALMIFVTGWRLIGSSWRGLIDRIDPADDAAIRAILDEELRNGTILGYHKVRHRHSGAYHWVDMHLELPASMPVREAHDIASRIEYRIEQRLGHANATAHVEPAPTSSGP